MMRAKSSYGIGSTRSLKSDRQGMERSVASVTLQGWRNDALRQRVAFEGVWFPLGLNVLVQSFYSIGGSLWVGLMHFPTAGLFSNTNYIPDSSSYLSTQHPLKPLSRISAKTLTDPSLGRRLAEIHPRVAKWVHKGFFVSMRVRHRNRSSKSMAFIHADALFFFYIGGGDFVLS